MTCDNKEIGLRYVYTCDVGLSVGGYSGIDNRLLVLGIFACDICSAGISISKITYIVSFCEFLVSANIG